MEITSHRQLRVYQHARANAQEIYELAKTFPDFEKYGLISQILRSSRSVRSAIAEGWRRRRYPKVFVNKLSEAESEACETQEWVITALDCGYIDQETSDRLAEAYEIIMAQLAKMAMQPEKWVIKTRSLGE
jgi:four helix bundle protein